MHLRFGEFELDGGTRQLRRRGEVRHLGPKAFALLELLLGERPNVVTRERIRDRLWPHTFVSESTLATVVAEVRAALDPDAAQFLRTAHRVGYAFCGEATEGGDRPSVPARSTRYRLVFDDREVALREGENVLGRVEDGAVWLDSATVSRRHARVLVEGGQVVLEDLGSKNGTFLHDQRIEAPTPLRNGDVFRLGRVRLTLRAVEPDEATRTDGG